MNATNTSVQPNPALRVCLWCVVAVLAEMGLYASYRGHDARFHWFTHFFVGGAAALVGMVAVAARTRRPVPLPLVWPFLAHFLAMFPDFLFAGGVAHERWMDLFLGHISTHFMPGRNLTWFVVFLLALAAYLAMVARIPAADEPETATGVDSRNIRPWPSSSPRV